MKRFSLRTLLFATAVAAVAAVLMVPLRRAVVQKRGRDWVALQKGRVLFSHEYNAETDEWNHYATLGAPGWIGIDLFDSVDSVIIHNTEVKDLSPITDLQSLRQLAINFETVDKVDFSPLVDLPMLRSLRLDYTRITADRLAKLRALLPNVHVGAMGHPTPEQIEAMIH